MKPVYLARSYDPADYAGTVSDKDFDNESAAREQCERMGYGSVIKFARFHNLPGALPAIRETSISMDIFEDGAWRKSYIHG